MELRNALPSRPVENPMRSSPTILLIAQDVRLIHATRLELLSRSSFQLRVSIGAEQASASLSDAKTRLVLAHLSSGLRIRDVAHLIGKVEAHGVRIPVLAVDDTYHEGRARRLFQLGVTDYLGVAEHFSMLVEVLLKLVPEGKPSNARQLQETPGGGILTPDDVLGVLDRFQAVKPLYPGLSRFRELGEG